MQALPRVALITLVVLLRALTVHHRGTGHLALNEALRLPFTPGVGHLSSEQTVASMASIIGRPVLEITGSLAWRVRPSTGALMHERKIEMNHHSRSAGFLLEANKQELLRRSGWLDHDVLDNDVLVADGLEVPGEPLVPRVEHVLRRVHVWRHHDQRPVVPEFIHVRALRDFEPVLASVSRQVSVHGWLPAVQMRAHIAVRNDQPRRGFEGVERRDVILSRNGVEMQRAAVLLAAADGSALRVGAGRAHQTPLAALVETHVSFDLATDGLLLVVFEEVFAHFELVEGLLSGEFRACRIRAQNGVFLADRVLFKILPVLVLLELLVDLSVDCVCKIDPLQAPDALHVTDPVRLSHIVF